jgi:ABC-2 type transport system permease protein
VYLLTSIVLWTYFAEATGGCVQCLVQREALLRKIRFPRLVVPVSVSLTAVFNLGMNFIAVLVFALISGLTPTIRWLELLPIVLGFIVLATGMGMLLSALYVRYRDIAPIWEVVLQTWFYASPIMYVASAYNNPKFPSGFEHVALLNPVATMLTQMGHAFIDPASGKLPAAATAAGGFGPPIIALALIHVGLPPERELRARDVQAAAPHLPDSFWRELRLGQLRAVAHVAQRLQQIQD